MAAEFFQQQTKPLNFQNPQSILVQDTWARDFAPQITQHPPSNFHEFEQIYQKTNCTTPINLWSDEFSTFRSRQTPSDCSEKEQIAFERAFNKVTDASVMQYYDWDKEFENHETWESLRQRNFQPTILTGSFETVHTNFNNRSQEEQLHIVEIKSETVPYDTRKKWDRLRPDGIAYGYRSIHPDYETYIPTVDNPYLIRQDAIDGIEHTTLADSILALEAKVQLNPKDAKTWEQLGLQQQENERDRAAITALEKAVLLDPNCLNAWLALSVAYRNEHCRMDAFNCLEQWIANNPKYNHILQDQLGLYYKDGARRHDYITNIFLEAARASPGEEMDADVQVGLGVLFNMSEDFSKAIDCFKAALISKPDDYQLWNKVGATLANARDNAGAIEMYVNAIQINPSFVRARYNLAISYMNLGQHHQAAEHLLTSLSLQRAAALSAQEIYRANEYGMPAELSNDTSNSMWDSLRLSMYM